MEWALLIGIVALAAFWADALRAREAALRFARQVCERQHLMLLDETVSCIKLRLRRNEEGELRIWRTYVFEFTDTGDDRRDGVLTLLGITLETIELEPHRMM